MFQESGPLKGFVLFFNSWERVMCGCGWTRFGKGVVNNEDMYVDWMELQLSSSIPTYSGVGKRLGEYQSEYPIPR